MVRTPFLPTAVAALLLVLVAAGCGDDDGDEEDSGQQAAQPTEHGLTEEQSEQALVEIQDTTITVGEFADRLAEQSPYLRARYNSPERRREFLDNMVRFELLAAEAERRGLHELPEVQRTTKQVMIQEMMKELFEDRIKLSDISDEQIKKYYEEHRDEFRKPAQRRASHIQFRSARRARRVLRQLKQSPDDVELFRELAKKYNRDPDTKDRYGDLRFFSKPGAEESADGGTPPQDEVPEAVAEAAFELDEIGDIHPGLVRSEQGFHIVKLTGKREALKRSLEQARRPIQNRLWRNKREKAVDDFIQGLRDKVEVEEDFDVLSEVKLDLPDGGPPPGPRTPASKLEVPEDAAGTGAGQGGSRGKQLPSNAEESKR